MNLLKYPYPTCAKNRGGKNNCIKLYPQKIVKISHFKLDQETKQK